MIRITRKTCIDKGSRLTLHKDGELLWFTSPLLDEIPWIRHGFSTRLGGVGSGDTGTMNLSFAREENKDNVRENYRRIAAAIGFDENRCVMTHQTHTVNVKTVRAEDAGAGITRERDYTDVDALVTDAPDVPLVCFSADCVPILFADGKTHAVGCAHSGWRGTVGNITGEVLEVMKKEYGTDPADITAAIGPSICRDCYEVGYDVIGEFEKSYPSSLHDRLFLKKNDGKYLLDLWEACRQNLLDAGVSAGNISLPDVCTRCNPDLLFSHRIQHGRQGNLGAFIIRRN